MFTPDVDSPLEMSFLGGTRGQKGLIINNSPNRKLYDSGDTGPLLEIRLIEEGRRGIGGAAVAGGERFCI